MKVIELCGFPGSGKTYNLRGLSSSDINIITTEEQYKLAAKIKNRNLKTIKYIFMNCILILELLIYTVFYCKNKSISRYLKLIRYFVIYEEILDNKYLDDKIVLDQGIIQFIWSLSNKNTKKGICESIILNKIIRKIEKKYDLHLIYYKVDFDLAAKRASNRNGDCDIDKLGYNKIRQLYKVHQHDFEILLKYIEKNTKFIATNQEELKDIIIKI